MRYRIEAEEVNGLDDLSVPLIGDDGDGEFFDAVAKEVLGDEEYEAAYGRRERDHFQEQAFLEYVGKELEEIHGNLHPLREYCVTFSVDEPLEKDAVLEDILNTIRWQDNQTGRLKVDPRSRRAAYELYVSAVWVYGAPILGYAAAVSGSSLDLGYASLLGSAGMALFAHAKYKQAHLPSYEIGHNIEKKLSLEELETAAGGEERYELSYTVRSREAYKELVKSDVNALCRTPRFVKSMTWDQLAYIGKSAVTGTKEKAPVVKQQAAALWTWLRDDDYLSYTPPLNT